MFLFCGARGLGEFSVREASQKAASSYAKAANPVIISRRMFIEILGKTAALLVPRWPATNLRENGMKAVIYNHLASASIDRAQPNPTPRRLENSSRRTRKRTMTPSPTTTRLEFFLLPSPRVYSSVDSRALKRRSVNLCPSERASSSLCPAAIAH